MYGFRETGKVKGILTNLKANQPCVELTGPARRCLRCLRTRGRGSSPFNAACQWPFFQTQCWTFLPHVRRGGNMGGKDSLNDGRDVGTVSRLLNALSWYGIWHEVSRGCRAHGVMTIMGTEGLALRMTSGSGYGRGSC